MRIQFNPVVTLLFLAGLIATPAIAANSNTTKSVTTRENKSVQSQLNDLQKQLAELKQELKLKNSIRSAVKVADNAAYEAPDQVTADIHAPYIPLPSAAVTKVRPKTSESRPIITPSTIPPVVGADASKMTGQEPLYLPIDIEVPGQSFVSTGPYVGIPFQFAGNDLIIQSPSVNTDLQLLGIRKKIMQQFNALLGPNAATFPHRSHLLLSGLVEGGINYSSGGTNRNTSDIDITNVSLDAFFMGPSDWTLGFIEFYYDNGFPGVNNFRVGNSNIFINKAFITVGNLLVTPFYGTVGQFYVPFGTYSSSIISDPLTKLLTRTKARAVLLGFDQQDTNAFFGSVYGFHGDTRVSNAFRVNNGGINVGYKFNFGDCMSGKIGAGAIGNIADSVGMQLGNGFAFYELIDHRVPGINFRANASFGHFDFVGEYVGATTHFDVNDMAYNGRGAKPSAFYTELSYSFPILDNYPSAIGFAYSKSREALSLGIPLTRRVIIFNTSLFRNTLQSLEFRRDRNYASADTANGPVGAEPIRGTCTAAACTSNGKADNAVTAQFDYYF